MESFNQEIEKKADRASSLILFAITVFSFFFFSIFFLSLGLCALIGHWINDLMLAIISQAVIFLSAVAFLSISARRIIIPFFKNWFVRHIYEGDK